MSRRANPHPTRHLSDTAAFGVDCRRLPSPMPPSGRVSAQMRRHPRRDTQPELTLRKALHGSGLRYRVQYPVPGLPRRTIDIAFTKRRLAVFVDGCFWHGCRAHRTIPASNHEWWAEKLARNAMRDAGTDAHLRRAGWSVLRVWEHETLERAVESVNQALRQLSDDGVHV